MRRKRNVKIVATVGPASSSRQMLTKLFEAGVDVFRLNMSHGSHDEIADRHAIIREIEHAFGRPIGILADLQGPKLRVGRFAEARDQLERALSVHGGVAELHVGMALATSQLGDFARAVRHDREALRLDPALDSAHQALGQVCERLQDEDATLAAYRVWAQAGARTPLPFNKIAAILERRKDYRGALEAYTRSLEIEWNQPPVIVSKERMEQRKSEKDGD